MKEKILIVEDEFIVANDLRIMLNKAGYAICGIATSVVHARTLIEEHKPDWVLLDIILKGDLTGINLARELMTKRIPFLYISANTNQSILEEVKETNPYGFLVKPFRERDLLVMLDIARHKHKWETGQIPVLKVQESLKDIAKKEGIIGSSSRMAQVLAKVAVVAPTGTSVLILGESGTGKEKIAKAIHTHSERKSKAFVIVNCGALPHSLIESELFGHEKGAFTGAHNKRIGKFEQAIGGSIFLDEVGELPLESQVKLLRVLQEKEIARLGGDYPIKVDTRIIAATNRNLEREVAEGRFRLDLYYRLNVFPIALPPLREHMEDINELANYFLRKYAHKIGKPVVGLSDQALIQLKQYDWPGNIRQLEHAIERNILLATGPQIDFFDLPVSFPTDKKGKDSSLKTMVEMEKEHIMNALEACQGKVSGPGGAAEILGLPASTVYSKMKKLGIKMGYI